MSESQTVAKHPGALAESEIRQRVGTLDHWSYSDGAIRKAFEFEEFPETVAFVNALAWLAEKVNHHPDFAFGYDYCRVALRTHKSNGVTERDLELAEAIDRLTRVPGKTASH